MQLSAWLQQNKVRPSHFAKRIGVTPAAVNGWVAGTFWISRENAQKVFAETDGAVTPNDFMQTVPAAQ
jgi:3,4-dihydroxy 2-butanone 4-phosphate synthase/GTP cyclohydrolase II